MNRRGIALILSLIILTILTILAMAIITRSISESNITSRYRESTLAFWLAEGGVSQALSQLRTNYNNLNPIPATSPTLPGQGQYCVSGSGNLSNCTDNILIDGPNRRFFAHGFIPSQASARAERIVEVVIGDLFYNNAIYAGGDVRANGTSYSVNGNVRCGGDFIAQHPENVNGTVQQHASVNFLTAAQLAQLRTISSNQGYLNIPQSSFPATFTHPAIPYAGAPNVVYLESNLNLSNTAVHGFFIITGNLSLNGTVQIDGAAYVLGDVTINGGGGAPTNIDGLIWTVGDVRINGGVTVAYNQDHAGTIQILLGNPNPQDTHIISWRDQNNPYSLTP